MQSSAKAKHVSKDGRLDLIFGALADRTRRELLARLARRPAMITELAEPFAMSLPAVSRHIRVLENAGLVTRTIDGRVHQCALEAEPLMSVEVWLDRYRRFWDDNLEALANFVESGDKPNARASKTRGKS